MVVTPVRRGLLEVPGLSQGDCPYITDAESSMRDIIESSHALIGMEVEGTARLKLSPVMTHPVRTLLNEMFIAPPTRLLLRAYEIFVRTIRFIAAVVLRLRRHLRQPHPASP